MQPVMLIVGTRPECIKMMPAYCALKKAQIPMLLCSTAQHGAMLADLFTLFGMHPDIVLDVMRPNQDLFYLTSTILEKMKMVYQEHRPSLVLVQGDTTTAMSAALAAFYAKIPVMHVEAGLRTHDMQAPYPEEMNRRIIALCAQYHCAPTQKACDVLRAENIAQEHIMLTGNTVVDALRIMHEQINSGSIKLSKSLVDLITFCKKLNKKVIVLTAHRRESFGGGIRQAVGAVKKLLQEYPEAHCFFPVHPNPLVQQELADLDLASIKNMQLMQPLAYQDLVYLLLHADLVITDSGGIQEEAVSLGKPVIVLREKTERMEAVEAGLAQLVGTDPEKIIAAATQVLARHAVLIPVSVYGDGHAAEKIVEWVQKILHGGSLV